jgi:hypothetical protein
MEVKDIQDRIVSAIEAEESRQIEQMISEGKLSIKDRQFYVGGQIRNIGKAIAFDIGAIMLVKSIEIDNIARDIDDLFMREEISEGRYNALMEAIN